MWSRFLNGFAFPRCESDRHICLPVPLSPRNPKLDLLLPSASAGSGQCFHAFGILVWPAEYESQRNTRHCNTLFGSLMLVLYPPLSVFLKLNVVLQLAESVLQNILARLCCQR